MSVSLRRLLPPLIPARLLGDTANQLFNPFLGTIAAGIGISNQQLGLLVSLRSLSGLAGPVFGHLADRRGHLNLARLGIVLMAVGLAALGLSNSLWSAAAAMLPMGLAMGMINPALQAYVSSHVKYGRRARGMGIFEYSWALSGIIGLSGIGWIIAAFGWRAAVFTLAGLMLASLLGIRNLPAAPAASARTAAAPISRSQVVSLWAGIAAVGLTFFGVLNVMIIHGVWLTDAFAFTPALLGTAALVLGLADLAGASFVSLAADRIGARRVALTASLLSAGAYMLPVLGGGLLLTGLALVLMRLFMQMTFVATLPVLSEQRPTGRARVLALTAAAGQVGMAIAAASGPWLYANLGPTGLGAVSAASSLAAFALLLLVRERKDTA